MARRGGNPPRRVPEVGDIGGFGRVSTGNVQADEILGGGFPANSLSIIMGLPGTGKTVFLQNLVFANAGGERPILYLTTLAEPLAKVVRFVQQFRFYDPDAIGHTVIYEDTGSDLAEGGPSALVPRLKDAIRSLSPKIVVIDSFRAVHDLSDSVSERRRIVHELTGVLTAYDTTAFLAGEYVREDMQRYPEFAVADSLVEVSRLQLGTRDERYFRVLKLRGSRYLQGSHAFRISESGLEIYPRLVAPRRPDNYAPVMERTSSGVPGLDAMLDGGVWAGSATLVAGASGSGKTTLALQFALEAARRGEAVLYVNFQENPGQLARTIRGLGGDSGQPPSLNLLYVSPVELQIDSIVVDLFRRIEALGIRRLVLDSVNDLSTSTGDAQRLHDYMYSLIQHLTVRGVTSMLTMEAPDHSITGATTQLGPISYMSDNLLLLNCPSAKGGRTIRVLKTRGSAHDEQPRGIQIGPEGIMVEAALR